MSRLSFTVCPPAVMRRSRDLGWDVEQLPGRPTSSGLQRRLEALLAGRERMFGHEYPGAVYYREIDHREIQLGPPAKLRHRSSFARSGLQARAVVRVVPLAVKGMVLAGHGSEVGIGDLDASGIAARVPHGGDRKPAAGRGRGDEINDDVMADERPPSPVHRDVAEEPMFDRYLHQVAESCW